MALLNVEKRIVHRFICRTPQSASPTNKGAWLYQPSIIGTPHCVVDLHLGTRGTFIDRASHSGTYEFHVPDAPVLLNTSDVYVAGARETSFGLRRLASHALSCLLGAALAAGLVGAAAGFIALIHIALPSLPAVAIGGSFLPWAAVVGAAAGLVSGYLDYRQWATANEQFMMLRMMADTNNRLRATRALPGDEAWARQACSNLVEGDDWLLSQAALEFEGAVARAEARRDM